MAHGRGGVDRQSCMGLIVCSPLSDLLLLHRHSIEPQNKFVGYVVVISVRILFNKIFVFICVELFAGGRRSTALFLPVVTDVRPGGTAKLKANSTASCRPSLSTDAWQPRPRHDDSDSTTRLPAN